YQREGDAEWHVAEKDLEVPTCTWDTNALPDGRYRIRVVASDGPDNAINEALETTLVSPPFTIDNTPPEGSEASAAAERHGRQVRGRARDASTVVTRLEIPLDAHHRTIAPPPTPP